jgi:hypothetical protein
MESKLDQTTQQILDYPDILIYRGTRFAFNPHLVKYSSPKPTSHGGYVVQCTYPIIKNKLSDGTNVSIDVDIMLQTPVMQTTFGMSTKEHDKGKIRGTVDLCFSPGSAKEVDAFHDVLLLWDKLLLKRAQNNKKVWFKSNKITDDILQYLYNPIIRKNKSKNDDKEYPDSFRSKIPRRFNRFECEVYNAEEEPISLDEITRGCTLRKICRHTGIWFGETMFVSSFETPQIQKMGEGKLSGYAFVDPYSIKEQEETSKPSFKMVTE